MVQARELLKHADEFVLVCLLSPSFTHSDALYVVYIAKSQEGQAEYISSLPFLWPHSHNHASTFHTAAIILTTREARVLGMQQLNGCAEAGGVDALILTAR